MKEEDENRLRQDPAHMGEIGKSKSYAFARTLYWMGVGILAYSLIGILYQLWPLALLQPEWQLKLSVAFSTSSIYLMVGILLLAAAPMVDSESITLAKRASLIRRLASWVAIGYLLLIPLQIYAGVKVLQAGKQRQINTLNQARGASKLIASSTTWPELRQAWAQIPGRKPNLPETISNPFAQVKDGLVDFVNSRINTTQTEVDRKLSELWQDWLARNIASTLQLMAIFVAFAAIGRKSSKHPTLLESLIKRKSKKKPAMGLGGSTSSKKPNWIKGLFGKKRAKKYPTDIP